MRFLDCQTAVELVMLSKRVPVVVGEAGIGKTTMMRTIAKKNDMKFINIDGNLLKEGEIGGLPVVEDRVTKSGKVVGKKTVYSLHHKLLEVFQYNKIDENAKILLFIDELNRSEHTVIQELMNLILNREINGFKLPDNCYVVCAMNPATSDDYQDANYQVTEMDAAQSSRMVWLNLETNLTDWLDWASSTRNENKEKIMDDECNTLGVLKEYQDWGNDTFIHLDIIEFLSSQSNFLHQPESNDVVKPTPRTWEMASDIYKTYLVNKDILKESIFVNCLKGCVGVSASTAFIDFIRTNKQPLIKPEEFFKDKLSEAVVKEFKSSVAPRQMIMMKNCIRFLGAKELEQVTPELEARLIQILELCPKDLMISMMSYTKNNFAELSDRLLDNEDYQMLFIATKRQLSRLK